MSRVTEVVGVYDADGGLRGELAYVVGHLLGRVECSLCDVTHAAVRRKPEWDAMAARLPVTVRLVHRNETTATERAAWATVGLPVVLGATVDGDHVVLLDREALGSLEGSVEAFEQALGRALEVAT
ncbi:hypothetical protein LL946_06865 [Knoellia locipacati]|uniref:hypothetical protein n=1 Tax=Knoellia locipacati TaxID=882824 RepID=UPI003850057E